MSSPKDFIQNPHLEGDAFFWQGGPTGVLLFHGFTATTAEVRLLGRYLHDRGYTVAGPLLPGHGTTPSDMNRREWREWTTAGEQAYRELRSHCPRLFVGGESVGALVALYLAASHSEILGLLLYAPALRISPVLAGLARLLAPAVPHWKKSPRRASPVDRHWKGYTVYPLRSVSQMERLQREIVIRLPQVHQPLLVIQGRLDQTVDLHGAELIVEKAASSEKELHWMEESTHCVILDREWERAAELTVEFIERISSKTDRISQSV